MKPKLWSNESDRQTEDEIKKTGAQFKLLGNTENQKCRVLEADNTKLKDLNKSWKDI